MSADQLFRDILECAAEVTFRGETVRLRVPDDFAKTMPIREHVHLGRDTSEWTEAETDAWYVKWAAMCLELAVVVDEPLTEAEWTRVIMGTIGHEDSGMRDLIEAAKKACGFQGAVDADKVRDLLQEKIEGLGSDPSTSQAPQDEA